MICEAFREGKLILVNANLASQKLEHEHQERMIDRLLEYNRQLVPLAISIPIHQNNV